jgi:hypothetical protein
MEIDLAALHTTPMGEERIRRNLHLDVPDVVAWCGAQIRGTAPEQIIRKGKNWYVYGEGFLLTINAYSHTIITAHKPPLSGQRGSHTGTEVPPA